jgi:hypothetical protein
MYDADDVYAVREAFGSSNMRDAFPFDPYLDGHMFARMVYSA